MEDNLKKILNQDISNGILKLILDDNENKNAAGTAQDTVGHPGTNMPIKAKIVKIKPRD